MGEVLRFPGVQPGQSLQGRELKYGEVLVKPACGDPVCETVEIRRDTYNAILKEIADFQNIKNYTLLQRLLFWPKFKTVHEIFGVRDD